MEEQKVMDDEIEIIDDFSDKPEEVEMLFADAAPAVVTPVAPIVQPTVAPTNLYADTTYTTDNSLSNASSVVFGNPVEATEPVVQDTINIFNVEEPVVQPATSTFGYELPKVEVAPTLEPVMLSSDPTGSVESPDLSDELDNTLLLAKQAINPDLGIDQIPVKTEAANEEKSNKTSVIFIVMLFVILIGFILALPYITQLVKNLN